MTRDELLEALEEQHGPGAAERYEQMEAAEELSVAIVGDAIGYGNMMQLAERLWRKKLADRYPGAEGGEHSVGPCASFLVPCPCLLHTTCDWCCGSGRVTKRVAQAMVDEVVVAATRADDQAMTERTLNILREKKSAIVKALRPRADWADWAETPTTKLGSALDAIAGAETGRTFLGRPERWQVHPRYRCPNGHVSTMLLKTEKGRVCLDCHQPAMLTFPEDRDGPLVAPAEMEP